MVGNRRDLHGHLRHGEARLGLERGAQAAAERDAIRIVLKRRVPLLLPLSRFTGEGSSTWTLAYTGLTFSARGPFGPRPSS